MMAFITFAFAERKKKLIGTEGPVKSSHSVAECLRKDPVYQHLARSLENFTHRAFGWSFFSCHANTSQFTPWDLIFFSVHEKHQTFDSFIIFFPLSKCAGRQCNRSTCEWARRYLPVASLCVGRRRRRRQRQTMGLCLSASYFSLAVLTRSCAAPLVHARPRWHVRAASVDFQPF